MLKLKNQHIFIKTSTIATYKNLLLISAGLLAVFFVRTWLAASHEVPRLLDLFDTFTVLGSLLVCLSGLRYLRPGDWAAAPTLGLIVGLSMIFATLFSPYPFFGVVRSNTGQALLGGVFTTVAALGGLAIMRQGGPVQFQAARGAWQKMGGGILIGLAIGLPFAVLNVFALQFTQSHAIIWQSPLAALSDALQPGIIEEVIYRFALWGLFWLMLRSSLSEKAIWWAGLLSMLVHNFSHFNELFLQAPLAALGMGTLMALFWGFPPIILARRRGLESAIAFHWIQDAARFLAGF